LASKGIGGFRKEGEMNTLEATCKLCGTVFTDSRENNIIFLEFHKSIRWNRLFKKVYVHVKTEHHGKAQLSNLRFNIELVRIILRGFLKDILFIPLRIVSFVFYHVGEAFEWASDKIDCIAYRD
jgi:hypothetical protein